MTDKDVFIGQIEHRNSAALSALEPSSLSAEGSYAPQSNLKTHQRFLVDPESATKVSARGNLDTRMDSFEDGSYANTNTLRAVVSEGSSSSKKIVSGRPLISFHELSSIREKFTVFNFRNLEIHIIISSSVSSHHFFRRLLHVLLVELISKTSLIA